MHQKWSNVMLTQDMHTYMYMYLLHMPQSPRVAKKFWKFENKDHKEPKTPKQSAIKWSQIRLRIELRMRKTILRFEINLHYINFFFLDSSIHINIFKQVPTYLHVHVATGL
jgi:hypothetical protein